ncbi:MAG: class I SAM-dependent methyltransferase [Saprospiraceae bacterium]|nr:class I SAM-dependent methyltransferase [Saprospiraceae bacterium]MBP7699042.1 class I SAM-dependent methyltransferase [Saprospiraceae bacterium]
MTCRHCNHPLTNAFCDLQTCPPSNAMVKLDAVTSPETYFPLKVFVCEKCWLVQVDELEKAEAIFNDEYTYFSSYSTSWLQHAKEYAEYMSERFGYNGQSLVVEIASNDGYLLQYFKEKNIPVLGVEPTANTAQVAIEKGIENIIDFFGSNLAESRLKAKADLILGNNVLAHVPDINDFVKGVKISLKPNGVNTFEFPHLCKLVEYNQFDTIYHEHFSYLSLTAVKAIFEAQGLEIFDVQELPTHGGSLRIFAKHQADNTKQIEPTVQALLEKEHQLGVSTLSYYTGFQEKVDKIKYDFTSFLIAQKAAGKKVIGYGAAAKGNTLLNYCGIKGHDLISFVVDASPYKQNKLLPGSRIPVVGKEQIAAYEPDYVIIFPWNLKTEITEQLSFIRQWGGQFVVAIPELQIF